MLIVALIAGIFVAARLFLAAVDSLRQLPRSNEDWCWY
jgi:hypothetical protein